MNQDILSIIDLIWGGIALTIIGFIGFLWKGSWISRPVLIAFLIYKLALGTIFSLWAILSVQDFDARGYFLLGLETSVAVRSSVQNLSPEYFETPTFLSLEIDSTTRLGNLTGVIGAFSGNSFLAATYFMAACGAIGQLLLFRLLRERWPVRPLYLFPVLFHPSLTLWSGMLLKDSLGVLALGMACFSISRLCQVFSIRHFLLTVLGCYLGICYRPFIVLMIGIFALVALWDYRIKRRAMEKGAKLFGAVAYWTCSFAAAGLALFQYVKKEGPSLVELQRSYVTGYSEIAGGSTFANVELSMSFSSVVALPVGIVNTLCRPFFWEIGKINQVAAAIENTFVLGIVIFGWYTYALLPQRIRADLRPFMWGTFAIALVCAAGVGLYSSNMGTISRYRIPGIPFLLGGACVAIGMRDAARSRQVGKLELVR